MKRIQLFFYFVFLVSMSGCNSKSERKENDKQPNFVIIYTDDLGYGDIGCFGANDIETPHIDRIADEGMKFTSAYSAASVCSPSRAALMTGRYPQRMGINSVFFPESYTGMDPSEITIAEVLKDEGYTTGMVGKWHLGHRRQFLPLQQGFDEYFGIPYSNDMESIVYMRGNEVEEFHVNQQLITLRYTEEALSFIENYQDKPFFLYLSHNMPHVPIYASDKFKGTSNRGLYGDVIQEIDWSVGQILEKLERLNLLENTMVIFSSDNGPWLVMRELGGSNGILREGKGYTFEGGMRVPTIAMWKGTIPSGSVHKGIITQMDLFPTMTRLAGGNIPHDRPIDGVDITNVLTNNGSRKDSTFLFMHLKDLKGYRKGKWKVKRPFAGFGGNPWRASVPAHDSLLFNLEEDPGEDNNLFDIQPELARKLFKEMEEKFEAMQPLPPSKVIRTASDNSHLDYLRKKYNGD